MMIMSPEEFLQLRWSSDPAEYNRAASEEAPREVWVSLITDHPDARFWVAQNKTVPADVLQVLAGDPDARVRWMVASKRRTPPTTLDMLAMDIDEAVRLRVARNPSTSGTTLTKLLSDEWEEVSSLARDRLAAG